jgi:hypothetical protein
MVLAGTVSVASIALQEVAGCQVPGAAAGKAAGQQQVVLAGTASIAASAVKRQPVCSRLQMYVCLGISSRQDNTKRCSRSPRQGRHRAAPQNVQECTWSCRRTRVIAE